MYNNQASGSSGHADTTAGDHLPILPPNSPQLRTIPLPSTLQPVPRLHMLLEYAGRPRIAYDLRRSPTRAQPLYERLDWLYESATFPPTSSLALVCVILPEPIVVFPSCRDYHYVTLKDVLSAVHEAYRRAAPRYADDRRTERESVPSLFSGHSTAATRHMWAGLSDCIAPGTWLLHIEKPQ